MRVGRMLSRVWEKGQCPAVRKVLVRVAIFLLVYRYEINIFPILSPLHLNPSVPNSFKQI